MNKHEVSQLNIIFPRTFDKCLIDHRREYLNGFFLKKCFRISFVPRIDNIYELAKYCTTLVKNKHQNRMNVDHVPLDVYMLGSKYIYYVTIIIYDTYIIYIF